MALDIRGGFLRLSGLSSAHLCISLFGILGIGYVIVHLITLVRSPTPFFDETFYADVADSLRRTGELKLQLSPLYFDKPVYIYGPLYFLVTAGVFELIGFGSFQFRLVALGAGLAVIAMVYKLLRLHGSTSCGSAIICALLALDPTFYKSLHSGRMDSLCLFLFLLSLYLLMRTPQNLLGIALSGLAAAAGLLTTPRAAYLLVPLFLIVVQRWWIGNKKDQYLSTFVWAACVLAPYGVWIVYAFGSIPAMLHYYRSVPGGTYLGGLAVRYEHLPLLFGLLAVALTLSIRSWSLSWLRGDQLLFSFSGIALFYLIVHDVGPYVFLMVPLAYLALGVMSHELSGPRVRIIPGLVIALLLSTSAIAFLARNALVWAQWEERSPDRAKELLAKHVPAGAKVVGDDKYYFAARMVGAKFQTWERGGTLQQRVAYHNQIFPADFLVTERSESSPFLKTYVSALCLKKLDSTPPHSKGAFSSWISAAAERLGFVPDYGYTATLWGRVTIGNTKQGNAEARQE